MSQLLDLKLEKTLYELCNRQFQEESYSVTVPGCLIWGDRLSWPIRLSRHKQGEGYLWGIYDAVTN